MNAHFAALGIVVALFAPAMAAADPHVDLAWDSCVGPLSKSVGPGSVADLFVSVLGQTQAAQSYEIAIKIGTTIALPDAWRFDPTGCQGSDGFTINHLAPASVAATCPSFQGTVSSIQIRQYNYDASAGWALALLADLYPNGGVGNPAAIDPAQRYFLADFRFNQQYGVAGVPADFPYCGGLEQPICLTLNRQTWVDTAANPVEHAWAVSGPSVVANDPNDLSRCPGFVPVAARPATWGAIKSQYRN